MLTENNMNIFETNHTKEHLGDESLELKVKELLDTLFNDDALVEWDDTDEWDDFFDRLEPSYDIIHSEDDSDVMDDEF